MIRERETCLGAKPQMPHRLRNEIKNSLFKIKRAKVPERDLHRESGTFLYLPAPDVPEKREKVSQYN